MSWWSPTKLGVLREQLTHRLRRRLLPYWAVFEADFMTVLRSWVLRAWFVLTALFALVTLLDHRDPLATDRSGSSVISAILHPVDTRSGTAHVLAELLGSYIIVWMAFVIVLTGGTICSELGVLADSVLSRGISRWQYFFGKWTSRLAAILAVYLLVMLPTSFILWFTIPAGGASRTIIPAQGTREHAEPAQFDRSLGAAPAAVTAPLSLPGMALALGHVAAILALVVTCSVAASANFSSSIISITVAAVSLYGSGMTLGMLGLEYPSPAHLVDELPGLLVGSFSTAAQCWTLAGWLALSLAIGLLSGAVFARRDV